MSYFQPCSVTIKKFDESLCLYKLLILQTHLHNKVFSSIFNRGYVLLINACSGLMGYVTVRLVNMLDLPTYSMFPICWILATFELIAVSATVSDIYEKSCQKLASCFGSQINSQSDGARAGHNKTRKVGNMEIQACTPLKHWIGNLYFVKKSSKLTLMSLVINTTLYLLLTF